MCAVNEQLRKFNQTGIKGDGRTTAELAFEQGLMVSIEDRRLHQKPRA